jgi:hypothetical protein
MKCISLLQPWATLIIHGVKRFETREPAGLRGLSPGHTNRTPPTGSESGARR